MTSWLVIVWVWQLPETIRDLNEYIFRMIVVSNRKNFHVYVLNVRDNELPNVESRPLNELV